MADTQRYIKPSQEAGAAFFSNPPDGAVVMLNLLRFREVADYSDYPQLAPDAPISGREAYRLYAEHTIPLLERAGSRVIFTGEASSFLIGPEAESWDAVLLVEHASAGAFLTFAQNGDYLAGAGHRDAALADSRLLPIVATSFQNNVVPE